jgi:hypothetical protein
LYVHMRHSAESKMKFFTKNYALCLQRGVDSALCGIVRSRSTHIREYLHEIETKFKNILKPLPVT